jgi:hypothetical protein
MKLFDKKAIELSVNFLVTFILAIVVFGAGMFILRGMIDGAGNSLELTQSDLDEKISQLSCSSKDAMCVSNNDAKVQRGKSIIFGVTINNYLSQETEFSIKIVKTSSDTTNPFPAVNDVVIDAKSSKTTAFGINVPKDTTPGQYSYVIRVDAVNDDGRPSEFAPISKRYNFRVI